MEASEMKLVGLYVIASILTLWITFLVIGLIAMLFSPPTGQDTTTLLSSIFLGVLLLIIVVKTLELFINSIKKERRRLHGR